MSKSGEGDSAAPIAWATADTCQLVVAGADLAAAIVDSGLRVVVWRLDAQRLLHRVLFPQRVAQLAMQVRAADPSRAWLWAVSADGAVFEQELLLHSALCAVCCTASVRLLRILLSVREHVCSPVIRIFGIVLCVI